MAQTNVIPDPSAGLFNCSAGMDSRDSPINLSQNQVQLLQNAFPGQPASPRNGCVDIAVSNTPITNDASEGIYLPSGGVIKDGNGVIRQFGMVQRLSDTTESVSEIWESGGRTEKISQKYAATPQFGIINQFEAIYAISNSQAVDNYDYGSPTVLADRPLRHKIIEYAANSSVATVRDMSIDSPSFPDSPYAVSGKVLYVPNLYQNSYSQGIYGSAVVKWKNRIWVIGGNHYDSGVYHAVFAVHSTSDMKTWRREADLPALQDDGSVLKACVFRGKMFVCSLVYGSGHYIYGTSDGITWNRGTTAAETSGGKWSDGSTMFVYNGRLIVLAGGATATNYTQALVWNSLDGSTFGVDITNLPYNINHHSTVVYNGVIYLIGGYHLTSSGTVISPLKDIYSSSDNGKTWAIVGTSILNGISSTGIYKHSSIVFGNQIVCIGGYTNADEANDLYSIDTVWGNDIAGTIASAWISLGTYPTKIYQTSPIIFSGKIYSLSGVIPPVTPGYPGFTSYIYSSADAVTWSQLSSGLTNGKYYDLAFTFVRRTDDLSKMPAFTLSGGVYKSTYEFPLWEAIELVDTQFVGKPPTSEVQTSNSVTATGTNMSDSGGFPDIIGKKVRLNGLDFVVSADSWGFNHNNITISGLGSNVFANVGMSVMPDEGDPIETDLFTVPDLESPEDSAMRVTIYNPYDDGRIAIPMSAFNLARNQGATHFRVWMTIGAADEETAQGLAHAFVSDIPLMADTSYGLARTFLTNVSDAVLTTRIEAAYVLTMTTTDATTGIGRAYTHPPLGRYIEYAGGRMWVWDEVGNAFYSAVTGEDGLPNAYNTKRYASMFVPVEYFIAFFTSTAEKNTGVAKLGNDLYFFKENSIFSIANSDPKNQLTTVSTAVGCSFPYTLTKANVPILGGDCLLFLSNSGPCYMSSGGVVGFIDNFAAKELWPDERNQGGTAGELLYNSGLPTNWYSRNKVSAHFSHNTWWIKYGDSTDTNGDNQFTTFKMFGYCLESKSKIGTLQFISSGYEPQISFRSGTNEWTTLCHDNANSIQKYRLTRFLQNGVWADSYYTGSGIGTVTTSTFEMALTSGRIWIAKSREYARQLYALILFLNWQDDLKLHMKMITDLGNSNYGRLQCEGDFAQARQSGVANAAPGWIANTGVQQYRNKVTAMPPRGFWGACVDVSITKMIPTTGKIDYHGFALKVIGRDISNDVFSKIGAISSPTGALSFVVKADAIPEHII
jgi:hypothetical protein